MVQGERDSKENEATQPQPLLLCVGDVDSEHTRNMMSTRVSMSVYEEMEEGRLPASALRLPLSF